MAPQVSIIVTSYNVAGYIQRAISSALDQTGVELEVILVDDCSTDDTWEVAGKIDDPRLKKLRLAENGGPSVARNAGIAQATGEWIAVLDGDDSFLPGRLKRCLAWATSHEADIVVDNLFVFREADGISFAMYPEADFAGTQMLSLARFIESNRLFARGYTLGYLKPILSAAFLKRHALAYDPGIRIGEDYLLLAEALAKGARCAVQPKTGYRYTIRAGSISHKLTLSDIDRMLATDDKFIARNNLSGASAAAQKRRTSSLKEAHAFTRLVDALKAKDMKAVLAVVARHPLVARQLWRPLAVRVRLIAR